MSPKNSRTIEPTLEAMQPNNIREQLERVLHSDEFARSGRRSDLLRYIVEETLAGRSDRLKGFQIGLDVFNFDANFDPQTNPIVRVEVGRLRHSLDRYYSASGAQDPIRIHIPKGSNVARFEHKQSQVENRIAGEPTSGHRKQAGVLPGAFQGPSIAVLPFADLVGKPDRNHFSQGFAEDLSIELARFQDLDVIAYDSALAVGITNLRKAGTELGADFVLSGSVRRDKKALRFNVKLSLVKTGKQVWAEHYEAPTSMATVFAVQDEIIREVVAIVGDYHGTITRTLARASRNKRVKDMSAYEAILQNFRYIRLLNKESHIQTRAALEHALEAEPEYATAWSMLGALYGDIQAFGLSELEHALDRASDCAKKAIFLDPTCQYAHYTQAYLNVLKGHPKQVVEEVETMLELNPNSAFMVGAAGVYLGCVGEFERASVLLGLSKKLNPYFPGWFHYVPFLCHYEKGQYDLALSAAESMNMPTFFWDPLTRAAAHMRLGNIAGARAAYQQLIHLRPDFTQRARRYTSCFVLSESTLEQLLTDFDALALTLRKHKQFGKIINY